MSDREALEEAARLLAGRVTLDAPLGVRTTYRVGGSAALLLVAERDEDLAAAAAAARATRLPTLVLGRGSNVLVSDAGFRGIAIVLGDSFARVEVDPDAAVVTAGGAAALPTLARQASAAGVAGLEWAVGIPGTVGGAVCMNAGGHGAETIDHLDRWAFIDLLGGPDGERGPADLVAGYRHTAVARHHVVTWARFRGRPGNRVESEKAIAEIVRWRRANQPGGQNAGSVFTNPPGDSAGRLVDAAGAKGLRVGTAEVSTKHANFIQADPGGRADDVVALIAEVRRRVIETTGVVLEPEVRLVGFSEVSW